MSTEWDDVMQHADGLACPDCDAEAGHLCHWWCPRYAEDPDDGYSFADAEDIDD